MSPDNRTFEACSLNGSPRLISRRRSFRRAKNDACLNAPAPSGRNDDAGWGVLSIQSPGFLMISEVGAAQGCRGAGSMPSVSFSIVRRERKVGDDACPQWGHL